MSSYIEDQLVRKLELRIKGKSTLDAAENELSAGEGFMDRAQTLAANRLAIAAMKKTNYLNADGKILSHKKILGKFIVFIKRLIRKGVRWYIRPPLLQQSEFNRNSLEVIANLQALLVQQNEMMERLHEDYEQVAHMLREQMALQEQTLMKSIPGAPAAAANLDDKLGTDGTSKDFD